MPDSHVISALADKPHELRSAIVSYEEHLERTRHELAVITAGTRGEVAARFAAGALEDAAARLRDADLDVIRADDIAAAQIIDAAATAGADVVVTPYAPVGHTASMLDALERDLAAAGLALVRPRRSWDNAFWPHATRGYSQLSNAIPQGLAAVGLA